MTWLKIGDEFPAECSPLSDAAVRTHVEALSWVMKRETGGLIETRHLHRLAETTSEPLVAVAELVARGFWVEVEEGWRIKHHMGTSPHQR